jgi:tetratricopeptide (TPR) repeat protein
MQISGSGEGEMLPPYHNSFIIAFLSRTVGREGFAMMLLPKRQTRLFPPLMSLFLLIALFPLSCRGGSVNKPAETRDIDLLRLSSKSHIARFLKDFEAQQSRLLHGDCKRADTLILLSQSCWTLGELVEYEQRLDYYQKGINYANLLLRENPGLGDGYYWKAINLCGVAEVGGAGRALRLLPEIVETMEKAAAIDPTIDQAGPHRVLGRIFSEAPAWPMSVGDIDKSFHHLTLAVQIAPDNTTNHLYLAETLLRLEKQQQALAELQRVLSSTRHATWPLGVEKDRQEARRIMEKKE